MNFRQNTFSRSTVIIWCHTEKHSFHAIVINRFTFCGINRELLALLCSFPQKSQCHKSWIYLSGRHGKRLSMYDILLIMKRCYLYDSSERSWKVLLCIVDREIQACHLMKKTLSSFVFNTTLFQAIIVLDFIFVVRLEVPVKHGFYCIISRKGRRELK